MQILAGKSFFIHADHLSDELRSRFQLIDIIELDGRVASIKELRAAINLARQKPLGDSRLLIIKNCQLLSVLLQNTLLKILEEPPLFLTVILLGSDRNSLIATVQSRLQTIAGEVLDKTTNATIEDVLSSTQKEKAHSLLLEVQKNLLNNNAKNESDLKILELINQAVMYYNSNVNHKLISEWLRLQLSQVSGKSK